MGILQLYSLIKHTHSKHITTIPLTALKNQKIAIDIQIFLYMFQCLPNNTNLVQNMYMMCQLFLQYNIIPLFVFDNRSASLPSNDTTVNKSAKRKQRNMEGNNARKKIKELMEQTLASTSETNTAQIVPMHLKQKTIRVSHVQIERVKQIIDLFGFAHIDAPDEADEVCAHLVITGHAYGCLSGDTDMMAYGCVRVFQNLNMTTHTIQCVDVKGITETMGVTFNEFREICALSQNDYNCEMVVKNTITSTPSSPLRIPIISETIKLFDEYRNEKQLKKKASSYKDIIVNSCPCPYTTQLSPFYKWITQHPIYNKTYDTSKFKDICEMYDISQKKFPQFQLSKKQVNHQGLKNFVTQYKNCFYLCD